MRNPHITPGFWRGVNNNQNAIYLECFMDELALAAGQDPLEFRRKLMANHPKHLGVLNAVAEKVGWDKPAPVGVYRGIAQHMGYGSYVAAAAEVSVRRQGQAQDSSASSPRPTAATRSIRSRSKRRSQARSSTVLSAHALPGMHREGRQASSSRTSTTYNCMRIDEMPKVEAIIMPSGDFWGGVGEPTIFVAAPAVLNAIFAATGKRIRNLPLKDQDIKKA